MAELMAALKTPLAAPPVELALYHPDHYQGWRAACAEDDEIWQIYPISFDRAHFDESVQQWQNFEQNRGWVNYIALYDGQLVGMTSYIDPDPAHGKLEIGGSYIVPRLRGTGYNRTIKQLMIDHAFACGYHRIEFRVDTRNRRSMAAVKKLGAQQEGILRQDRKGWTGYVRDTAIYGLLKDEWRAP